MKRGAEDVLGERGNKNDEQVAVRHADASGGCIIENQHEKKRKRDIQVNERGSEATNEEQTDEGNKMVRFEQEALNTSASSDPYVALEHPVRDETPGRPGTVLVQKSFDHITALDVFYEKDERDNRCIGEVLERYRREDAGDLKRSELDVLVESWTCLNAVGRNILKSNPKILMDERSWKTWKSNQKIVMDEEFVKNFVMGAKIDPKFVMDLSVFKIGGWGSFYNPVIENCWKKVLRRMIRSCCRSEFQAEISSLRYSTWNDNLCVMIRT